MSLILETKDKDALGIAHDRFKKGDITSFVVVTVDTLGNAEVSYDVNMAVRSHTVSLLNKLGGGLLAAAKQQAQDMQLALQAAPVIADTAKTAAQAQQASTAAPF